MINKNIELADNSCGHTYMQWIVAVLLNTVVLNYGLQVGWISPMTKVLQSETSSVVDQPISDESWMWIASAVPMTAVVGVPLYTYLSDKYGRKVGVIAIVIPQSLCWIIKLATTSVPGLLVARVCAGIAAGGCFTVIPMYVKELSQDNIRGLLVSLVGLNQNLGYIFMYAMGAYLEYYTVLWIVVWLPLVLIILLTKLPESPAFLIKIGEYETAARTVALLRGLETTDKEVIHEITYMKNEDNYFKSLPPVTFLCILRNKPWRKGLILLLLLLGIQACNGCFAIVTYISSILGSCGVTISLELQTLSIPAFMIFGSFVTIVTVDRIGRKPLLVITYAITVASFLCLASILLIQHQGGSVPGWLPVIAIVSAMWSYAAGVTSVPGVIMAEMFNFQIRAKVVGCVVMWAWLITFLGVFVYTPISNMLGMHTSFYGFAGINLLGFFVSLVFIPETKGKSVEEIELMLGGGHTNSKNSNEGINGKEKRTTPTTNE
ncbi:facilitated trehalose transporter Tret1-2 homolog [Achroia grisella]|uniref:facilitated trehalose transporter Tret1-2 homolog n=1 Tax=Achroia grisella TaxID=688607 RepID=UPI0027D2DF9D|nr:facilitated trehalose transporter Tret1-2 homolog [Achroia grisella]